MIEAILHELEALKQKFDEQIIAVNSANAVEALRIQYLARKGELPLYFKKLGEATPETRPQLGQKLNELRDYFEAALNTKKELFGQVTRGPKVDLTLPGIPRRLGTRHPLLKTLDDIKSIFIGMGFTVESGPLAENDYHNFEALNIPRHHPAREMQDTLYLSDPTREENEIYLLRTHTSPVQVRTMLKQKPPIRIIAPGRVFRKDNLDATHSPVFHQIEGLYVDEGVTMGDLKGVLLAYARKLLGRDIKVRFRPSYFPFTEPSAELDVWFPAKNRWMELLGCGMVNPAVFDMLGIDSEKYTGFAFGMGIERVAMTKYGIDDIRYFYDNDVRFLHQF